MVLSFSKKESLEPREQILRELRRTKIGNSYFTASGIASAFIGVMGAVSVVMTNETSGMDSLPFFVSAALTAVSLYATIDSGTTVDRKTEQIKLLQRKLKLVEFRHN